MSRFYNPGTKIDEKVQYTHPTKDPKEGSTLSYYPFMVAERDFVEVPDVLTLDTPEGEVTVAVNFAKRIRKDHQSRGVILIDSRLKNILDDDNAAADDKEAKRKGDLMWREYLKTIAQEHVTRCEEIRSMGNVPRGAFGLTKYALDFVGMSDPALSVEMFTKDKESRTSNAEMVALMQSMRDEINQLKGAQSARNGVPSRT